MTGLQKEEEKKNMNEVKENKIQMIRHKAVRRRENKMHRKDSGEGSKRSVKTGATDKDFKDGITDQPVALEEDCSNIQGGFSLHYLFTVIVNTVILKQHSHYMTRRSSPLCD